MSQAIVFISYSHHDEAEKDKLMAHLGVLQKAGLVSLWNDDYIGAGGDWQAEIRQTITQAKVAILLITANYLNSDFIIGTELPALLQQRQQAGLVVLPIIARACAWRAVAWLQQMRVRPKTGQPVWRDGGLYVDEDLALIAEETLSLIQPCSNRLEPQSHQSISTFPQHTSVEPQPTRSYRVMVVDDEPSWQRRLRRILKEVRCSVVCAGDYEQAEELLEQTHFDLITIDLNLDKSTQYSDGLELVLRARELYGANLPIIIVTGTGNLEEQRRAFKDYGVFDFIQKAKLDLEEFQRIAVEALRNQN